MPNTTPPIDSASIVREVQELARTALCHVAPVGALTEGRRGERLAPYAEMAALGVRIFSDDGDGVQDNQLMRRAMEYARPLGVLLAQHCEDRALAGGGVMHEGEWSSKLGLPGQPSEAEELMVMRDLALCRLTSQPVHFLHLSTVGSVELVRRAKASGLPVTAEATTHHLTLTDAACAGYDPVFKVHPPLRTDEDVAAVRAGILDGTIDAVATDHAPHAPETKDLPFDEAPPGMLGLETALAILLSRMDLPLERVLELASWRPAELAGLRRHGRPVSVGEPANLCVIDPAATWVVDGRAMASRSRNTPYQGWELTGRVRHTVFEGEPVVVDGEVQR
jgi:dihydroorotase